MKNSEANTKDGRRLMGLQQALYVMSCLNKGMDETEIATRLDDDSELVEIWIQFLCDREWIKKDNANNNQISGDASNCNLWLLTDICKLGLAHEEVFGIA